MSTAEEFDFLTVEEYLRLEEKSSIRHEYVDGFIFAMAGANSRHNIITGNIFAAFHGFLAGTPCRPYVEAYKVHVQQANCFYYPDVLVACDKASPTAVYTQQPISIVEVLSPSTAAVDRREKLSNYTKLPSLREYLIVHQHRRLVECYQKSEQGGWLKSIFAADGEVVLESLPKGTFSLSLNTIYDNVQIDGVGFEVHEDIIEYQLSAEEAFASDW